MLNRQSTTQQGITGQEASWWLIIVGLLLLTFCLGLPQLHYTAALMIAAILRHKGDPTAAVVVWQPALKGHKQSA